MTPTPPSTSSSGASPDAQYRVVRKRNRVPLSCGPCRHRKLKCNRGHPCDNCTKRGETQSCTYAAPGTRKKNGGSSGTPSSPDEMQNRIDRLEGLVLSLMTNGVQSAGPTAANAAISSSRSNSFGTSLGTADAPADLETEDTIKEEDEGEDDGVEQVSRGIGVMKVDNGRAIFASDAHWYAILSDIAEVKNYFSDHKKQYEDQLRKVKATRDNEDNPGTSILFRGTRPVDRGEVLASFPAKHVTDKLVERYFNCYDPAVHIIHGPTFQRQYDQHWANPSESPLIWFGLVYAMMTLALQSYHRAGDEPPEYLGNVMSDGRRGLLRRWRACESYVEVLLTRRVSSSCSMLATAWSSGKVSSASSSGKSDGYAESGLWMTVPSSS